MNNRLEQASGEWRALRMGASLADRVKISAMLAHAHLRCGGARPLFSWLPAMADPPRPVTLRSGRSVVGRRADGIIFYEHFGMDVYGAGLPLGAVNTIVDLGAHVGFSTLALSARYPRAKFVCVEPFAASRRLLVENLARNQIDAQVLDVAVVGTPGRFDMRAVDHYPAANQIICTEGGEIEGITLPEVLDRGGIEAADLVKIDIEGAERGVFEHAADWAPRVRALIGELHEGLTPAWVASRLEPHGYREVRLPDGERFKSLACFARSSP